jgi:hypothetical protein
MSFLHELAQLGRYNRQGQWTKPTINVPKFSIWCWMETIPVSIANILYIESQPFCNQSILAKVIILLGSGVISSIYKFGGGGVLIYPCFAQFISSKIDCFYSLWTWIDEYVPPPQLSRLATLLLIKLHGRGIFICQILRTFLGRFSPIVIQ